jgi:hypothetical protein
LNIAYSRANNDSPQEWGCYVAKVPSPSYLKVEIEPLP